MVQNADDGVDALMSNLIGRLIAGQTADVVALLGSPLSERPNIGEVIGQAWRDTVSIQGSITGIGQPVVENARADGSRVAIVVVHCAEQPFQVRATINSECQVTTFHLQLVSEPKASPGQHLWTAPGHGDGGRCVVGARGTRDHRSVRAGPGGAVRAHADVGTTAAHRGTAGGPGRSGVECHRGVCAGVPAEHDQGGPPLDRRTDPGIA